MPAKEEAPLERLGEPRARRDEEGKEIWWCRVMVPHGEKLSNGPLCQDATHRMVQYGRRVVLKSEVKIRDAIWVCADCKPQRPAKPLPRVYPPRERHPEPVIREMGTTEFTRIINGHHREQPWYAGPEPKVEDYASVAEWRAAHRTWEQWSRDCWSARMSQVSLHQRLASGDVPASTASDYEA